MLFNSPEFLFVFLPLTLLGYYLAARRLGPQPAFAVLVGASLFFYAWWRPAYLPLLVGSIAVNFALSRALTRSKSRALLGLGIGLNLALLGAYKYADFFIGTVNTLAGASWPVLDLALPLAISFFTFQQIAFLVDSYKSQVDEPGLLPYSLFVSFFPQLIAGPIVHHSEMIPQFRDAALRRWSTENVSRGLALLSLGLFKKVVIADTFAVWANIGFDTGAPLGALQAWTASLSYTFQLYFDFSGYTDMATGAALLFNVRLPLNFNSPYRTGNIRDFWRCWHMTLSRWFRDYVYIPLGGNRSGELRADLNLAIVMLLAGLWHGAGWTFVAWGGLHAVATVVHRIWSRRGYRLPSPLGGVVTFLFVNAAWVFFRAESFDGALRVLGAMAGAAGSGAASFAVGAGAASPFAIAWLCVFAALAFLAPNSNQFAGVLPMVRERGWMPRFAPRLVFGMNARTGVWAGLLAAAAIARLLLVEGSEFLYFNF